MAYSKNRKRSQRNKSRNRKYLSKRENNTSRKSKANTRRKTKRKGNTRRNTNSKGNYKSKMKLNSNIKFNNLKGGSNTSEPIFARHSKVKLTCTVENAYEYKGTKYDLVKDGVVEVLQPVYHNTPDKFPVTIRVYDNINDVHNRQQEADISVNRECITHP